MREPLGRATVLALALVATTTLLTGPAVGAADDVVDAPGADATNLAGAPVGEPIEEPPAEDPAGDVAYDVWYDRWGQSLADVPVGAEPWGTWDLTGVLESPVDAADQYAMRMRTLLTPAETGSYRFFVSGDDDVRLFVDPTGDDPAEARLVAYVAGWTTYRQFDRFASQRSEWFELVAGQAYYVEVIGKEGSFGDHFSVAWEQRDGFGIQMVPGDVLESTMLGSGGWRTATPSGLPSAPSPMTDPGWRSVEDVESLYVEWNPVDGAEWYEVRLEGSGESREVIVESSSVEFFGLVPETRYLVEVAPANRAARMPTASTVRVTRPGPYPVPVAPAPGSRPSVSYDRWDTGWWTLTSVPFGAPPASTGTTTTGFETTPMQGDNHAARLRAVLTPTKTGTYTFFLSADDDARLLFNADGVDAKGAVPIASVAGWTEQYQWDRYQSQRSASFELRKGRSYYLEAISVHALGLDHLEVGWSRDGGAVAVVPSEVLSPTPAGAGGWRTDPSSLPHVPGVPTVDADGGDREIVVGWAAPPVDDTHGAATFYEVRLLDDDGDLEAQQWVTDTSATFGGLDDDEEYEVVVVAWNAAGPGGAASAEVETGDDDDGGHHGSPLPSVTRGHLVLATGTSSSCQGVEISGSSLRIAGDLRSNGTVGLYVGSLSVDGTLSYGVKIQPGSAKDGELVHDPDPTRPDLAYDLERLLAGDVTGIAVHRHDRHTVLGPSPAKGIHLVDGDVTISGSEIDLVGVTIVATGVINVSGSAVTASPAAPGLPSLATTSSSCGRAAINVSTSRADWFGDVVAPSGLVRFSGSRFVGGAAVVGAAVRMSGSQIELGFELASLQPVVPASAPTTRSVATVTAPDASRPTEVAFEERLPAPAGRPTSVADAPTSAYCPAAFPAPGATCHR